MKALNLLILKTLKKSLSQNKNERKVLLTIDDGLYHFIKMHGQFLKEKENTFYFVCKYKRSWCF